MSLYLIVKYEKLNWNDSDFFFLIPQERLNQVLMEKKKESRSGMEIMNLLQVGSSV